MEVAVITGGTRGIGAAIAMALAQRKVQLVINGRSRDKVIAGDANDEKTAVTLIAQTMAEFGRVDYVVPAAGGPNPGKVTDLSFDQWIEAFKVHVHAVFHLFRAAHPALAVRGGGFLMIGSVAGKRGCPNTIAYQTAKGALPQMARALARDHAGEGIRVNVVEPGIIRTRFHAAMTVEAERNNLDNRIPLHRFGTPEHVASAALELLTNPFITGETLAIDGGMSMRMV
jgi:NAD(P)-dependent dehydrogenase (short-subunit alcohol dehydrogenase family)